MIPCIVRAPTLKDWPYIAALFAKSIPNAMASSFGHRFGACYYRYIAEGSGGVCFAAFDREGVLAGVIIGTLDRKRVHRLPFILKLKLLAVGNFRFLSPAFLRWIANSRHTTKRQDAKVKIQPQAELLMIAIDERIRGQRLSYRLLDHLETFFRDNGLNTPYIIYTEKSNHAANALYEKLGARFIGTHLHHNKQINEWHKCII